MFDTRSKRYTGRSAVSAEKLAYLAVLVSTEAPARENKYASRAYIPWELVNQIRTLLAEEGFDWKLAATRRAELERERKRQEQAERYPESSTGDQS